jgi:hypothetical protein
MQLRDAQTSELIAEGTPLEVATLAAEMDPADVLFDGAGGVDTRGVSTFDPAEVRRVRAAELDALVAALGDMPATPPADVTDREAYRAQREAVRTAVQDRRDRIAAGKGMVAGARAAMRDARSRVRG